MSDFSESTVLLSSLWEFVASTFHHLLLPPHDTHEPHDGLVSIFVHLAYRVISHVVHTEIAVIQVLKFASENQPSNLYQSFVGFSNVIVSSIVYQVTLFGLFVHQSKLYVIAYVVSLNTPVKPHPVATLSPSQSVSHHEKTYHSLGVAITAISQICTLPVSSLIVIELHSSASILHVLTLPHSDPVKLRVKDWG